MEAIVMVCQYDHMQRVDHAFGAEIVLMGDPRVAAVPVLSSGACYTGYRDLPAEARHNREVMAAALSEAGFVNYPTEWWHWSYGDRYWALATGAPSALFGPWDRSLIRR
jgi:D-alanyl-D-alanine dipeptidase